MVVGHPLVAAANCEPGLNPNQPNQRINTPRQASVKNQMTNDKVYRHWGGGGGGPTR